jgi:hypothetical protein
MATQKKPKKILANQAIRGMHLEGIGEVVKVERKDHGVYGTVTINGVYVFHAHEQLLRLIKPRP